MPRYNGAWVFFVLDSEDVIGKLNCSIEWSWLKRPFDDLFNLLALFVFSLLLKWGYQCSSLHHLVGSVFSKFMEDSRVAEWELITYLFEIESWIFTFFFVFGVLSKNLVHGCQFLPSDGSPYFSVFLFLSVLVISFIIFIFLIHRGNVPINRLIILDFILIIRVIQVLLFFMF